jgi:hypothetical protein
VSSAARSIGTAVLGVLMFLALSLAAGLAARVREPRDTGLAVAALLVALAVAVVSTVLLRRAPRRARFAFAGAVAACIALGLVVGGPLDVVPGPWLLVVPDVLVRGAWSTASWLLLGTSATWALLRERETVPVEGDAR